MNFTKTFSGAILLIAFLSLNSFSCKKNDAGNNPPPGTGGAATVNGNYGFDGARLTQFSSTKAGIVQTTVAGYSTFTLSAIRDGGNESISIIVLKNITGPTTIDLNGTLANGGIIISKDYTKAGDQVINYSTDNNGSTTKGGGQIKITAYDGTNVEGTFYAVAYNSAGKEAFVEQGTFKGKVTH